jgi:hypothetical protein
MTSKPITWESQNVKSSSYYLRTDVDIMEKYNGNKKYETPHICPYLAFLVFLVVLILWRALHGWPIENTTKITMICDPIFAIRGCDDFCNLQKIWQFNKATTIGAKGKFTIGCKGSKRIRQVSISDNARYGRSCVEVKEQTDQRIRNNG